MSNSAFFPVFFNKIMEIIDSLGARFYLVIFLKNKKSLFFIPLLFSALTLLVSLNITKEYKSTATIIIEEDENKNVVNIQDVYSENKESRINNQIAILKSEELNQAVIENKDFNLIGVYQNHYSKQKLHFFQKILKKKFTLNSAFLVRLFTNNISVTSIPRSDVLRLSFIFEDPKIAQLTLDAFIEQYQLSGIDNKVRVTTYANTKISERLSSISIEMKEAEKKLNEYKVNNKLVDVGDVKELKINEIVFLSDEITKLNDQITNIENDLLATKSSGATTENLLTIKGLLESDEVKNKKTLLLNEKNMLSSMSLIYTETHPKVIKSKETIAALDQELSVILKKTIEKKTFELGSLKNLLNSNKAKLENATKELTNLEVKESGMQTFKREVDSSSRLYDTFLQRAKETNEAKKLQIINTKIIAPASLNTTPVSPNVSLNTSISYVLSFVLLYFLIFYREISNSTLKDAQSFAGMEFNVFANIPTVDETRKGYHVLQGFLEEPSSTFSESFRNIRTYTQKIFPNKNSFLITSSDPGEGKTTVAFNFALSLEKNSQVLIIEADIRKPSVLNHYYSFHDSAEEQLGLSDIMDNKAILSDTIQKVPGTNLDLITSGKKRYDLSDLVTVDQLRALVKTLQKKYDYIIIDSAPINPVTDTLILSQVIDCIFFVVRSEKTKVLAFLSAIKKLKDIQIDVSGIIINDIDVTKYSYYDYYSQNYYYGPKMDPQQT
tara:strand:- start:4172 stop:6343 length:2172 start_codon:yes stop_codon:yes gene_type:complete